MKIFSLILLISISLSTSLKAHTNEIIWLQNQRAPWMINAGQYKDQGYGDKIRKLFISKLSEYTHKTIPINAARMMKELKRNDNICYGPVGKFDMILSSFHWSKAIYHIPRPAIIVLNKTYEKMGSPKELSLEELIKDQNYNFGNHKDNLFYPIDLNKYTSQKNVTSITTTSPTTSLLSMLEKNRIDWIYDSTIFIKWHTSLSNTSKNFKTIKVTETKDTPYISGYIACSKNDWGKEVIDNINKNINKQNILKIRSYVRKWQLDIANLKEFDTINTTIYGY